ESANGLISTADWDQWKERALKAGGAVGKFMEGNPTLMKYGFGMLEGAFGDKAQLQQLREKAFNADQSLLERNRANLNAPIKLAYTPR
ncbi:MAG: hypothetical protein ABIO71_11890, partial [Caldimonas sp.]